MEFCKLYCLKRNICSRRIVSNKDIKKINAYRAGQWISAISGQWISAISGQWISAIHMEEGFKDVIDKPKTNNITSSTVKEIFVMAVLRNDSSYRQLDCDKGLVVSSNSPYTAL
jgi:hypothetical protein